MPGEPFDPYTYPGSTAETQVDDLLGWPSDPRPLHWRLLEVLGANAVVFALLAGAGLIAWLAQR